MKEKQRSKNDEKTSDTGGGLGIEDIDAEAADNNFDDAESIFNQEETGGNEGYVDGGQLYQE
jgi:hypothetical protein